MMIFKDMSTKMYKDFTIPENPMGSLLKFSLYSNWGDDHYIGMKRIELFDMYGNAINFTNAKSSIVAV
jgi:hypothetical protein